MKKYVCRRFKTLPNHDLVNYDLKHFRNLHVVLKNPNTLCDFQNSELGSSFLKLLLITLYMRTRCVIQW